MTDYFALFPLEYMLIIKDINRKGYLQFKPDITIFY